MVGGVELWWWCFRGGHWGDVREGMGGKWGVGRARDAHVWCAEGDMGGLCERVLRDNWGGGLARKPKAVWPLDIWGQ